MSGESVKHPSDDWVELMNDIPYLRRRQCVLPGVDGPWVEHPDELKLFERKEKQYDKHTTNRTPMSYKEGRKAMKDKIAEFESAERRFLGIGGVVCMPRAVDLGARPGIDSDIEEETERYFVNHPMFAHPSLY